MGERRAKATTEPGATQRKGRKGTLTTRAILIIGASCGIGKVTAKLFQERGCNVVATIYSPKKEEDLAGSEVLRPGRRCMWGRLAGRGIDLISTDHTPSTMDRKLGAGVVTRTGRV